MGHNTDRLCDRFGVSRQAQDEFAARSHQNGAKAHADGIYDDEIFAYNGSTAEEGIRGDSTPESMAKLAGVRQAARHRRRREPQHHRWRGGDAADE